MDSVLINVSLNICMSVFKHLQLVYEIMTMHYNWSSHLKLQHQSTVRFIRLCAAGLLHAESSKAQKYIIVATALIAVCGAHSALILLSLKLSTVFSYRLILYVL